MKMNLSVYMILIFGFSFLLSGCTGSGRGNRGQLQTYPVTTNEAEWIRNGEPIKFEGEMWYPQDGVESLTDSEVLKMGDYRGVQYFIEKVDVRPYDRLYTKFDRNKFRYYKKKSDD